MKVRTGFVSNSSSSSFVVLGFFSDEEYDGDYRYVEDVRGSRLYGAVLAEGEHYIDDNSHDVETIITMAHQIAKKYGVDPKSVQLHTGTRPC